MKENNINTKKTSYLIKRFLPYFKKYKWVLILDLFCATLTTICDLVLPMIVRYLTDMGMNNAASLSVRLILSVGAVYLGLRVIDLIANYYMANIGHVMGAKIETDMRKDLFDHLQELSYSFYSNTKIGQLMARITSDLFDVTEFAHHCPEEYYIAAVKIIVSFCILSSVNVWLTLIIFAIIPVMIFFAMKFNNKMRTAFKKSRNQLGEINAQVEDSLLGVRVVKSFANEDIEGEKFKEGNEGFLNVKKEAYRYMAGFQSTTRLFDGVMYIAVVVAGSLFMMKGIITPPDLMAYLLYVVMLLASVRRIVEFTEQFQRGMTGIERFIEVMDEEVEIKDSPDATELQAVKGNITFESASFHYADSDENVLAHIDLNIHAGENVALVGPSGAGKTTLCNLIPRFYDVTEGRILIDGTDIRSVTAHSLRSQIGMVQQEVYLFSGTVYDNIEYGKPGASREEIIEAAKLAGAHEFIMQLTDGYDTFVGERGVKLSGGQKQRISIARVFLKNPPILILDEATSALDNESELIIQQSLEKLAKGRTTLTIAHRLTTIRNASTILVLTEDGIQERGSHEELMKKGGLYSRLYNMYTTNEETVGN
ncbi:ABC transporter ATP-binding protein/permease [Anaerovorax odorimutans]|uniref:ABC transporter ATP-binding protein/permease n=1 Tax=Anaerovorax odorimutans TaxID=109327 RepID=A0ABT1RKH0_9FIRM|nr:ABC transporter ATP-binding protein [Anaerovorax odorimutans]MCQ4635680.1 ABC transporter ATP-binding protein/permease [Anaerovorax odorimutans]